MGRYDGYWEPDLAQWDVAAGVLICREAGLTVESLSGGDPVLNGDPVTANKDLLPMLRDRLAV